MASDLLLNTDAVSILFKPDHALYGKCFSSTSGNHLLISFMTQAELMLWPRRNFRDFEHLRGITPAPLGP